MPLRSSYKVLILFHFTTLAHLGILVVVFIGQHVSAEEEPHKATEVDQPICAAEKKVL